MTQPMDGDVDRILTEIAAAVAEGRVVDWKAADSLPASTRPRIANLRSIDTLARCHRDAVPPHALADETQADLPATSPQAGPAASAAGAVLPDTPLRPTSAGGTGAPLRRWGHLEIREQLGSGSFGDVYRAYDTRLARDVALKLARRDVQDGGTASFLEEARNMARVRNANVLQVFGVDEHDGRAGFWTEIVEGQTLKQLVAAQGPMGAHEAAPIGVHLCRALSALHQVGLVHRDVKPANVMRERGGRIVLMDLGAASHLGGKEGEAVAGTPLFMSPEQLLRGTPATRASDIYALGVLLYWLVTARHPVECDSLDAIRTKLQNGDLVPLRDRRADLPTEFVQVVERALERDPAQRYASAGAMESDLARLGPVPPQQLAVIPGTGQLDARPASWWRRPRALAAVAAVIVAAAAFGAWQLAASSRLNVDATFIVRDSTGERPLVPGETVRPQDRIALDIAGNRDMHVYVLNEDAKGEFFVLFPVDGSMQNPLLADAAHRLPSRNRFWEVSTAGGAETLLVLASRQPLADVEQLIRSMPQSRDPASDVLAERGLGNIVEDETLQGGLASLAQDYAQRASRAKDLWVWQFQMRSETP